MCIQPKTMRPRPTFVIAEVLVPGTTNNLVKNDSSKTVAYTQFEKLLIDTINPMHHRSTEILVTNQNCSIRDQHLSKKVKLETRLYQQIEISDTNDIHLVHKVRVDTIVNKDKSSPQGNPSENFHDIEPDTATFAYNNMHSMIIAEILGNMADLKNNPVSRFVYMNTNKLSTVDQILYMYDHRSKMYTNETVPLFVTKPLVEKIVAKYSDIDCQTLEAIDTPELNRCIVNMKMLKPLIEFNNTHELFNNHFKTIHNNIKPPRKLNTHYIHLVVRKVVLMALTQTDVTNIQLIPNGRDVVHQFIDSIEHTHGQSVNFFYKDQFKQVIDELFNPNFKI